jgi:GT2 family glycosyltransferase
MGLWSSTSKPAADNSESPAEWLLWDESATQIQDNSIALTTRGVAVVICTHQRPESLKRFLNSLAAQDRQPDELIIVDASNNNATEQMLRELPNVSDLAKRFLYLRVSGALKGITHQRNFALRWVSTDLVAFFDDDVELLPHCLREMERVHRETPQSLAGVGAFMCNQAWPLADSWVWRMRLKLGLVPSLQPGRYYSSGISVPWNIPSLDGLMEGDWLPGCAMMWKTAIARNVGFYEGFGGYAQGEDLEFSLRARHHGRLVVSGAARVIHYYEAGGRPDPFKRGYMAVYNRYEIYRRSFPYRYSRDTVWFSYALVIDTLLLARYIVVPSEWIIILLQIAGRLKAICDMMVARLKHAFGLRATGTTSDTQHSVG